MRVNKGIPVDASKCALINVVIEIGAGACTRELPSSSGGALKSGALRPWYTSPQGEVHEGVHVKFLVLGEAMAVC